MEGQWILQSMPGRKGMSLHWTRGAREKRVGQRLSPTELKLLTLNQKDYREFPCIKHLNYSKISFKKVFKNLKIKKNV